MLQHIATIKPLTRAPGGCLDQFEALVITMNNANATRSEATYTGRLFGNEIDAINFKGIGCDGATDAELAAIGAALQSINQQ